MAAGMGNIAIDQRSSLEKEKDYLRNSRDFYKRRCEALQAVQDKMRDPELALAKVIAKHLRITT